jgi:hypothetical protein
MAKMIPPRRRPFMNRTGDSQPAPSRETLPTTLVQWHKSGMRKLLLIAAFLGTACSAQVDSNSANQADVNAAAPAKAAAAVATDDKTDLLTFHLGWPAEVSAIPALFETIRAPVLEHKAELLKNAADDKAERATNDYPFNAYEYSSDFKVAGATGQFLSLYDEWFEFTGGAHPNHGTTALLWDKKSGKVVKFADMFSGGLAQLNALFGKAYCSALDAERAKKREGMEKGAADDPFEICPKFDELVIIPKAGSNGATFGKVWFHADPYVAGPYAEGDYDVELPMSAAAIAALKPEYRSSFASS